MNRSIFGGFLILCAAIWADQPIVVTGKVILEDGSRPPMKVSVKLHCASDPNVLEAHTDKKGEFAIEVGNASLKGNNGNAQVHSCEVTAIVPGYQTATATVAIQTLLPDTYDVKLILRAGQSAGKTVSLADSLAPPDAKQAYDKARQSLAANDLKDARKQLTAALAIYPKYASAWFDLGRIQMDDNQPSDARQSFHKALAADPKFLAAYDRLCVLAVNDQHWQELADASAHLIDGGAFEYPQAYYFNARANMSLNHLDLAEKSARQALLQDPKKFVRANYLIGLVLARRGQFGPAAEQLKIYLASNPSDAGPVKKQLADFEMRAAK
jgi:tetratricopeptide (TPR) repeat protein